MTLKAVFLDVGWTLIHPVRSMWEIMSDVSREQGGRLSAPEAERLVHGLLTSSRSRTIEELEGGAVYTDSDAEFFGAFHLMTRAVFALTGIPGDHGALGARFLERFWNMGNWAVFPDVPDALRRLRASGLRVGVLSNAGSQLPAFLASLGLADLLDFAVVSAVEGVRKPDRRIFERALELAGARPEEALHVGDMYVEDVLGARRVGVRPILMDRGSRRMFPNHSEQGDFEVATSLAEIVAELGIGSNGGR